MDFRTTYQVNDFTVTIGWSDADRQFYAQLSENDTPADGEPIQRSLASPTDALRLLNRLAIEIAEVAGVEDFNPPLNDIIKLMDAPKIQTTPLSVEAFFANPDQYMGAAGHIYPDGLPVAATSELGGDQAEPLPASSFDAFVQFIDGELETHESNAEREDVRQEANDILNELQFCVEVLAGWQVAENAGTPSEIDGTLVERQSDILTRTAMNLVIIAQELVDYFSLSQIGIFAHAVESRELVSYESLFTESQRETIDNLTYALCRSKLSEFPQVVACGFNPVNGGSLGAVTATDERAVLLSLLFNSGINENNLSG